MTLCESSTILRATYEILLHLLGVAESRRLALFRSQDLARHRVFRRPYLIVVCHKLLAQQAYQFGNAQFKRQLVSRDILVRAYVTYSYREQSGDDPIRRDARALAGVGLGARSVRFVPGDSVQASSLRCS